MKMKGFQLKLKGFPPPPRARRFAMAPPPYDGDGTIPLWGAMPWIFIVELGMAVYASNMVAIGIACVTCASAEAHVL